MIIPKLPVNIQNKLNKFEERHKRTCFDGLHDVSGALLSYEYIPSSLGLIFICKCECGESLIYNFGEEECHINIPQKAKFLNIIDILEKRPAILGFHGNTGEQLYYFLEGFVHNTSYDDLKLVMNILRQELTNTSAIKSMSISQLIEKIKTIIIE